jgi:hypothetical protein
MATKRTTASDPVVSSGTAPARAKTKVTRKHSSAPAQEASVNLAVSEDQPVAAPPESRPPFEAIAQLAYSYWEARGYQDGSSEEDWLRAEEELSSRKAKAAAN